MVEFCNHAQTSQIKFRKKLAEALIYNEYYNEIQDKTPEKGQETMNVTSLLLHTPQREKIIDNNSQCEFLRLLRWQPGIGALAIELCSFCQK